MFLGVILVTGGRKVVWIAVDWAGLRLGSSNRVWAGSLTALGRIVGRVGGVAGLFGEVGGGRFVLQVTKCK